MDDTYISLPQPATTEGPDPVPDVQTENSPSGSGLLEEDAEDNTVTDIDVILMTRMLMKFKLHIKRFKPYLGSGWVKFTSI